MDKTLLKRGRVEVLTSRARQAVRSWQLYVLILPAIGFAIAFHYLPMYGIIIAFKDFRASKGIWGSLWRGPR